MATICRHQKLSILRTFSVRTFSVTNSMCHSYHIPFHGSGSSNFDFFGECVQFFFVIKKRVDFCFSIYNFCRGREPGLWRFLYLPDIYADFPCAKFCFNQLLIR